jgi:crotonobetainyl-CoA:carnitine CoA-transferase CaiB-like acyl-CoA transferase
MVMPLADPRELPLSGMRVVDLTRYVAGSYATMMLAALGADVIKVEDTRGGDPYRNQGTAKIHDASVLFIGLNVGKRSVCIDLGTSQGQEILDLLLTSSDFLVENSRTGSLAKFGLDFPNVHAKFPRVIYVSISGYGGTGPESTTGGFDLILQAESGIMSVTGEPEGAPTKVGTPFLDIGAGLSAVTGALAALQTRHRTGQGGHVTASLLGFGMAAFTSIVPSAIADQVFPTRLGSHSPTFAPYGAFRTGDGHVILAGAGNERLWVGLCENLGLKDLPDDPRFATNADRVSNSAELTQVLEDVLSTRPTAHWIEILSEQGIPVAKVRNLQDVLTWEQVAAMNFLESLSSDRGETYTVVDPPFTVDGALRYRKPAPSLGQHTAEVLEQLNMSGSEIAELVSAGVIGVQSHD